MKMVWFLFLLFDTGHGQQLMGKGAFPGMYQHIQTQFESRRACERYADDLHIGRRLDYICLPQPR